jgi:hypothetical protein
LRYGKYAVLLEKVADYALDNTNFLAQLGTELASEEQ